MHFYMNLGRNFKEISLYFLYFHVVRPEFNKKLHLTVETELLHYCHRDQILLKLRTQSHMPCFAAQLLLSLQSSAYASSVACNSVYLHGVCVYAFIYACAFYISNKQHSYHIYLVLELLFSFQLQVTNSILFYWVECAYKSIRKNYIDFFV